MAIKESADIAELLRDEGFAATYLTEILAAGEPAELLIALRQVADANGGIRAIARESDLNPNQLYRTLSARGNPELRSLLAVLGAMGLRLAVHPAHEHEAA